MKIQRFSLVLLAPAVAAGPGWGEIFASRELEVVGAGFAAWTEGPLWRASEQRLLFSSPSDNKLFEYRPETGISLLLNNSGQCPADELSWRAEPGSNGLAQAADGDTSIFVCQHGAQAIARLDLTSLAFEPVATHVHGKRFNSPNDLTVHRGAVYFTDPIYGLLERTRMHDGSYLDDKSVALGPGVKGLYRTRPQTLGGDGEVELLDASLSRPNGVQVTADGRTLVVSESCQGTFNPDCQQGTNRFLVLTLDEAGAVQAHRSFEFEHPTGTAGAGASDGFKLHQATGLIVGSCAGPSVCVVDPALGVEVDRVDTQLRISNVEFAPELGVMFVTGEDHLWQIPLKQPDAHSEL